MMRVSALIFVTVFMPHRRGQAKGHKMFTLPFQSNQEHRGEPPSLLSALGSFTCVTQHTEPTALRPIRRTKHHGEVSFLLKDTGVTTRIQTHTQLIRNARV